MTFLAGDLRDRRLCYAVVSGDLVSGLLAGFDVGEDGPALAVREWRWHNELTPWNAKRPAGVTGPERMLRVSRIMPCG
jgi:hypothetical protein